MATAAWSAAWDKTTALASLNANGSDGKTMATYNPIYVAEDDAYRAMYKVERELAMTNQGYTVTSGDVALTGNAIFLSGKVANDIVPGYTQVTKEWIINPDDLTDWGMKEIDNTIAVAPPKGMVQL